MKFCSDHWQKLRDAIDARGLGTLVSESGEEAMKKMVVGAVEGTTIDNFDPLMGAHNAIVARAMDIIKERYQQNPMMLFADEAEHPEWACPICALNWCHKEHDELCAQESCDYPKAYDWTDGMVEGAAKHMLDQWKELAS